MHRGNLARVAAFRMYVCVFVIRFALCTSVTPCAMAFIPVRVCRTIKETRHRNCKSWTMMQNEKGGKMYVSRSRMKSDDVLFIRSMQISLSQSLSLSLHAVFPYLLFSHSFDDPLDHMAYGSCFIARTLSLGSGIHNSHACNATENAYNPCHVHWKVQCGYKSPLQCNESLSAQQQ